MDLHGIERHKVLQLAEDGEVELSLAEQLIETSAYWYKHPSGSPVNSPGHAKRIYSVSKIQERAFILGRSTKTRNLPGVRNAIHQVDTRNKRRDWKVDFGANVFCISKAVLLCQSDLLAFLDAAEQGKSESMEKIKMMLEIGVCQSVENYRGRAYELYEMGNDNHMKFGANSIYVSAFIDCILQQCQTFKKIPYSTRQTSVRLSMSRKHLTICPICMREFKTRRGLDYHCRMFHYEKPS